MDEWAALAQAIADDPDDDARRLVAADWLEENGRGREAEFVRAQVQIARCVREPDDPFESTAGLWDRQLAPDLHRLLVAPLLPLAAAKFSDEGRRLAWLERRFAFGFRRGFLDAVVAYGSGAAARFARLAQELFARAPLLHLCVSPSAERPPREYPPEYSYPIGPQLTEPTLRALLELPLLARLRTLDLRGHRLGDAGAALVLRCPHLSPGVRLNLDANLITAAQEQPLRERFGDGLNLSPFDADGDIPF